MQRTPAGRSPDRRGCGPGSLRRPSAPPGPPRGCRAPSPALHRTAGPSTRGRGVMKLISGGQTGADRAALDVALELGIDHGGWVPKGRSAEDGPLPGRYRVRETPSEDRAERTKRNVADSDATLLISHGPLTGGSELTRRSAAE